MLSDRSYLRDTDYRPRPPVTVLLIIANVVIFFLQQIAEFYRFFPVSKVFALSLEGLSQGWIWQLLTFQFLHGGAGHLILNMLLLFFAGRAIEQAVGPRRMLTFYLIAGTAGGLLQALLMLAFGPAFGTHVVGASAGLCGLIAAFATLYPREIINVLLFFVVSVPIQARVLLWAITSLALLGVLVPSDNLADGAHLGGILTGVLWTKWVFLSEPPPFRLPRIRLVRRHPKLTVIRGGAPDRAGSPNAEGDFDDEDYMSREVDPILEKLHAEGVQSLTERERRILDAASQRMRKR